MEVQINMKLLLIQSLLTFTFVSVTVGQDKIRDCEVPAHLHGDYYSYDKLENYDATLNIDGIITSNVMMGECKEVMPMPGSYDAEGNFNARIQFFDERSDCYICWDIYYRTPNILQIKQGSCFSSPSNARPSLNESCRTIQQNTDIQTLFRKEVVTVNCKSTFEGTYQFTYEVDRSSGGICASLNSFIQACQEPGSVYVDNQVFRMNFARCPGQAQNIDYNNNIRFQCLGTWQDSAANVYSAMVDLGEDEERKRYRCMMTRYDQEQEDNRKQYVLSRYADCSSLKSLYDGPFRLSLKPAIYGMDVVQASCNLPRNFTGTWFTAGEFDTDVMINATHMYFKTKLDQYEYKEQLFTCEVNRDSRYLMSVVTVGKCEVDYVCLDFSPRHHNIIRWRMARPFRLTDDEMAAPDYLQRKFRQSCTWSSFTFNRKDIAWKYNTFILNPPAPVDCPIGGRYSFIQKGAEEEKFVTRIRGITERPRHTIDCREYVSEFKSCDNNPKKLYIDKEYCATLDHTGRPIGEYDIADRELSCVGYWMEDMRSYMLTYDEEDAVSPFRCWVYERLDWRDMVASRATRATCGKNQTAYSFTAAEGASLHLILKENERLFDSCPQRYDTGANPYEKELKIYVLNNGVSFKLSMFVTIIAFSFSILFDH